MTVALKGLRRAWRDDRGNATMEFVLVFPALLYIFFAIGEVGVLMARSVMLDRGVSIVMRDLKLGLIDDPDHNEVRDLICDNAFLISSCRDAVMLEMVPLATMTASPPGETRCVDRASEIEPAYNFDDGDRSEIVFVRACIIVDPLFPGTGIGALLPKDATGGYAIVAESAFVNEPI